VLCDRLSKKLAPIAYQLLVFAIAPHPPKSNCDRTYKSISQSEILELAGLDIDLLTHCVLMAQTSRLEAANTFCNPHFTLILLKKIFRKEMLI
jgi:hypothetical protein